MIRTKSDNGVSIVMAWLSQDSPVSIISGITQCTSWPLQVEMPTISKVAQLLSIHGSENHSSDESSTSHSTNSATKMALETRSDILSSKRILSNIVSHSRRHTLRSFRKRKILRNSFASSFCEFFDFVDEIFVEIRNCLTTQEEFFEFPKINRKQNPKRTNQRRTFVTFGYKSKVRKTWIPDYHTREWQKQKTTFMASSWV